MSLGEIKPFAKFLARRGEEEKEYKLFRVPWQLSTEEDEEDSEETKGDCDPPWRENPVIRFDAKTDIKSRKFLQDVIHECTHARFWDIAEKSVDEFAVELAKTLEEIGYTLVLMKKG